MSVLILTKLIILVQRVYSIWYISLFKIDVLLMPLLRKKIVLLGAGRVGARLASVLSLEEHDVTVIDRDPSALKIIAAEADVAIREGSATDIELLHELMEGGADYFLGLTGDNEKNLVSCSIAKNLGYKTTIARVLDYAHICQSRLDVARLFFIDHLIGTDTVIAQEIMKCLLYPQDDSAVNFAQGSVQLHQVLITEHCTSSGITIKDLPLPHNVLVGLILRKEGAISKIIYPCGNDVLKPGDKVTVIGESHAFEEAALLFGSAPKKLRSVFLSGNANLIQALSLQLSSMKASVTVFEENLEQGQLLARKLPHITVLNRDPADYHSLIAENIEQCDAFIACYDSTEKNIVSAAVAKQAGCTLVVAMVSDVSFVPLLKRLGIHAVASATVSVVERIRSIIDGGGIASVSSAHDGLVKILEKRVSPHSNLVGVPIVHCRHLLPKDCLLAMIENRGNVMIPRGNHVLCPGDTVIVLSHPDHVNALTEIL